MFLPEVKIPSNLILVAKIVMYWKGIKHTCKQQGGLLLRVHVITIYGQCTGKP